ncbi:MAG TPA: MBL fold metallo-hydrolase [Woeseiaceae bacterium]
MSTSGNKRATLTFLGAAGGVTGSCYLLETPRARLLLECGQVQGTRKQEGQNRERLPLDGIDAVVLSHAHIDHSGRLPLLYAQGYRGPVYTHDATRALCDIMLLDSAFLHEKDAEYENGKRERKGLPPVEPLYTREQARAVMGLFESVPYDERREILPGVELRLSDAGHILGSAIVELWIGTDGGTTKLVFSGDLGFRDAPVMDEPARIDEADVVLMESTYGDRDHRPFAQTLEELQAIFLEAADRGGNVLIPAFAVGRSQDLLYLMAQHFDEWQLGSWRIFLDSPMAIEATAIYAQYRHLYSAKLFDPAKHQPILPNIEATQTSEESMRINAMHSGAIVIAGSGMCNGGRILHHLKHNLWRPECHVVLVGYQAEGTLGRRLVDGAPYVRLWQEAIRVQARIHTVGGLSAHAGRSGLIDWYSHFNGRPPVHLVHGEERARAALAEELRARYRAEVHRPRMGSVIRI